MISYKVTILRTGWKWESIHQGEEVTNDTHCCPLKKKREENKKSFTWYVVSVSYGFKTLKMEQHILLLNNANVRFQMWHTGRREFV